MKFNEGQGERTTKPFLILGEQLKGRRISEAKLFIEFTGSVIYLFCNSPNPSFMLLLKIVNHSVHS